MGSNYWCNTITKHNYVIMQPVVQSHKQMAVVNNTNEIYCLNLFLNMMFHNLYHNGVQVCKWVWLAVNETINILQSIFWVWNCVKMWSTRSIIVENLVQKIRYAMILSGSRFVQSLRYSTKVVWVLFFIFGIDKAGNSIRSNLIKSPNL